MKRSTKSFAKKTSNLYQSIHQPLSVFALAAVVAVASVLALTQPSEAKIVYTLAKVGMYNNGQYKLDLNNDGIADFTLQEVFEQTDPCYYRGPFTTRYLSETPAQGAGATADTKGFPTALDEGVEIGSNSGFNPAAAYMAYVAAGYFFDAHCRYEATVAGNWINVADRYLGLEFQIHGKLHFGWARLTVQVTGILGRIWISTKLTGYAYETIAGKSIKAGQTKEAADDPTNEDFGPGASLTNPIPNPPQPASLGMLALGAQGVPLWRRKESLAVKQ
jgi:hypothetical protein